MSVLIKALAAAENNKQKIQAGKPAIDDFALTLPSNDFTNIRLSLEEEAGLTFAAPSANNYAALEKPIKTSDKALSTSAASSSNPKEPSDIKQKAAARAFVANHSSKTPTSRLVFALLGVAGILMIWLGIQGYALIKSATSPDILVIKPKLSPQSSEELIAETAAENASQDAATQASNDEVINDATISNKINVANIATKLNNKHTIAPTNNSTAKTSNISPLPELVVTKKTQSIKLANSHDVSMPTGEIAQNQSPIKLVSKQPSSVVDPTLQAAYQAFIRGDNPVAQQQYRQVLQQDVRNIDALLGMAAIAQRQNRDADAMGWYQKVLELEPRNPMAQIAVANQQLGTDAIGTESRIKSMIARQPDAGILHAALGNLYAGQNEWASAQEAYFNASRYAPNNADYAFNMAISLDQLGKSNLALNQYQRALDLLNKSGASSPDKSTLEARIAALK